MKKIILSESQSKALAKLLKEDEVQQMPVDKKMNKPFYINPEKVLVVKKYLDKGFEPQDYEDVGPDGFPRVRKLIKMKALNGEPLKLMYTQQLLDLLIDKFQNMFSDKIERGMFLTQVLKDWLGGKIGVHGNLSVNILKEGAVNEITSADIEAEGENVDLAPTEKQKEAGNYKMGHISIKGMGISIENPRGSYRSGKDSNGQSWTREMKNHYGYFRNTRGNGKDGDAVDVFIGPYPDDFNIVYVIDQKVDGEFDESKVMLGFHSKQEAKEAYLSNYSADWNGFWKITGVSLRVFKRWLYRARKQRKPFADYVAIKKHKLEESVIIAEAKDSYSMGKILEELNSKGVPADKEDLCICVKGCNSEAKLDEMVSVARRTLKEYASVNPNCKFEEVGSVNEEDISPMQMYNNVINVIQGGEPAKSEPAVEGWKRVKGEHGKYNLQNQETGELVSEKWFDWVGHMVNGVAIVRDKNLGYNLINDGGKILLPDWHEDILEPVGRNNNGEYTLVDGADEVSVKI